MASVAATSPYPPRAGAPGAAAGPPSSAPSAGAGSGPAAVAVAKRAAPIDTLEGIAAAVGQLAGRRVRPTSTLCWGAVSLRYAHTYSYSLGAKADDSLRMRDIHRYELDLPLTSRRLGVPLEAGRLRLSPIMVEDGRAVIERASFVSAEATWCCRAGTVVGLTGALALMALFFVRFPEILTALIGAGVGFAAGRSVAPRVALHGALVAVEAGAGAASGRPELLCCGRGRGRTTAPDSVDAVLRGAGFARLEGDGDTRAFRRTTARGDQTLALRAAGGSGPRRTALAFTNVPLEVLAAVV